MPSMEYKYTILKKNGPWSAKLAAGEILLGNNIQEEEEYYILDSHKVFKKHVLGIWQDGISIYLCPGE